VQISRIIPLTTLLGYLDFKDMDVMPFRRRSNVFIFPFGHCSLEISRKMSAVDG